MILSLGDTEDLQPDGFTSVDAGHSHRVYIRRRKQLGSMGAVVFASDLKIELANMRNAVEALNRDVTAQLVATGRETSWVNAWRRWRAEFTAFYDTWWPKVKDPILKGAFVYGVAPAYDKVLQYRAQYGTYLADFQSKVGGRVTDPAVAKPPPPVGPGPSGKFKMPAWGWAIIGIAGVGAVAKLAGVALPFIGRRREA